MSSKSSKSHSMLLSEFLNSVVVHSASAADVSPSSLHRKYNPLVLFSALNTSLHFPSKENLQNNVKIFNKREHQNDSNENLNC